MNFNYSKLLKLSFLTIFFILASCNKNDDPVAIDPIGSFHNYDVSFSRNGQTLNYSRTITTPDPVGQFVTELGNNGGIYLNNSNRQDFNINGVFVLDSNGSPLALDYQAYPAFEGSRLQLVSFDAGGIFKAVSGTANISELKIEESSNALRKASFTVNFEGEFDLFVTATGEIIRYTGTGTVKVGKISL